MKYKKWERKNRTELMEHKVEVIRTGNQDEEGYKVGREARKQRK